MFRLAFPYGPKARTLVCVGSVGSTVVGLGYWSHKKFFHPQELNKPHVAQPSYSQLNSSPSFRLSTITNRLASMTLAVPFPEHAQGILASPPDPSKEIRASLTKIVDLVKNDRSLEAENELESLFKVLARHNLLTTDSPYWKELSAILDGLNSTAIGFLLHRFESNRDAATYAPLLKMAFNADFEIPVFSNKESALADARSLFDFWFIRSRFHVWFNQQDLAQHPNPARIIELTLFKNSIFDSNLLPSGDQTPFYLFVFKTMQETPFEKWPEKGSIIVSLSRSLNPKRVELLHKTLATSTCDELTPKIGRLFLEAFKSLPDAKRTKNLRHIAAPINELQRLLPGLHAFAIRDIFNVFFPALEPADQNILFKDPIATRRLEFNGSRALLVVDDLFICKQRINQMDKSRDFLMAYNRKDGSLIWGIETPLRSLSSSWCQNTPLGIPILLSKTPSLRFLDPKTGDCSLEFELPAMPTENSQLYITPSGFIYYTTKNEGHTLFGGNIVDGSFKEVFRVKSPPPGFFKSLGEFVCFDHSLEGIQTVYSQAGSAATFENCSQMLYAHGKIYSVHRSLQKMSEREREKQEEADAAKTLALQVQDLSPSKNHFELLNDPIRHALKAKEVNIESICDDGICVCKSLYDSYSFVNIEKHETFEIEKLPNYGQVLVDPKTTSVWSWNTLEKQLIKHTLKGKEPQGTLSSGRGTTLLCVDTTTDKERICFVDIPY